LANEKMGPLLSEFGQTKFKLMSISHSHSFLCSRISALMSYFSSFYRPQIIPSILGKRRDSVSFYQGICLDPQLPYIIRAGGPIANMKNMINQS
jgi:hypothetical protein